MQWTLAYVAVAWVLFQAISQLAQDFDWPIWIPRLATMALALGVLPAIVVAWFHGEKGAQRVSATEILILAVALAVVGGSLWSYSTRISEAVPGSVPAAPATGPSIAVLPFASLSDDSADDYFADGMQDELISRLSTLHGVSVVSRTSTLGYRDTTKPIRQVASELGVALLVEATVRRADGRVRVTAKLIDAAKDTPLWSQTFERALGDTFRVQADVARMVADSIGHELAADEASALGRVLSSDPEAIDLYFQGLRHYDLATDPKCCDYDEFDRSRAAFERAIARDRGFAAAYARLATMLSEHYIQSGPDYPQELAEAAKRNAAEALRLAPDSADTQLAVGMVRYNVERAMRPALEALRRAVALGPSNADAIAWLGYCLRRMGRWDEAIAAFERARRLAVQDARVSMAMSNNIINTLVLVHRPSEALAAIDDWIAVEPANLGLQRWRAGMVASQFGDDRLLVQFRVAHPEFKKSDQSFEDTFDEALAAGDADAALSLADRMSEPCSRITPVPCHDSRGSWPQPLFRAVALRGSGRIAESQAAGRAAMQFYAQLLADPTVPGGARYIRLHAQRAVAAAFAGDPSTAGAEIAPWLAAEADPEFDEQGILAERRELAAVALAGAGDNARAFAQLRFALGQPGRVNVFWLRTRAHWFPDLRDDPRWVALIDEYQRKAPQAPPNIP